MLRYLYSLTLLASLQGFCADNTNARIEKLETDMRKIRGETAYNTYGSRVATASPQIDGYGFYGSADFLWWKAYEGGSDYVLRNNHIRHVNFDWEPGFKVGGGYLFDHDAWDADIEFTFFRTHTNHSLRSDSLFPLVGDQDLSLNHSKAKWRIHFYNLDLVVGKNYFVSKYLAFRPFFALTIAWIDQNRRFKFHTTEGDQISLKGRNDFSGVGPKLGVGAQYFFCEHFSCYGDVSGDLLWGDFSVREREDDKTAGTQFYNLRYNLHRMVPVCAFELGLSYEVHVDDDTCRFRLKAGYESQYWWRQNQLPIFNADALVFHRYSEDLGLQGLTVEARLDF